METTVTGVCVSNDDAKVAVQNLIKAGFSSDAVEQVDADTPGRHERVGVDTAEGLRGARIGALVAGIGMAVAGAAMSEIFETGLIVAVLGCSVIGVVAGAVVGLMIGSATGHQVQDEYEHLLDDGGVLIAVHADRQQAAVACAVLRAAGAKAVSAAVHRKIAPPVQQSA